MIQKVDPAKGLKGVITDLPADKSIAHRAAMFAALAEGESVIYNYPDSADPQSTIACLEGLGCRIERHPDHIKIFSKGRNGLKVTQKQLDCGNSGTTMRLLSGIVAGAGLEVSLTGDASLSARPMNRVLDPLRMMGASCESSGEGRAPIRFKAHDGLKAIDYTLPVASAQVKSCVLLAGLFAGGETTVTETMPSRDHTERMLGLPVERKADGRIVISSSRSVDVKPARFRVPGDISGAAFWLVAGSLVGNAVITLNNTGLNPTRSAVTGILKRMGASITLENMQSESEPTADITVRQARLKATSLRPEEIPNAIDEIPVLAVAMCFAGGVSEIRNAGELRAKETDRIRATVSLLRSAGAEVKEFEDGFEITGNNEFRPKSTVYDTWHDHRIAMAASVMALMADAPSEILEAECVKVSYPAFFDHLDKLCVNGES